MSTSTIIAHRPDVRDIVIEHLAADEAALRAYVAELERDVATYRDLLCEALAAVADRDRTIRRLRLDVRDLRAQVRAAVSGRTIADERQALDREALDVEHGHDDADEVDDAHRRAA